MNIFLLFLIRLPLRAGDEAQVNLAIVQASSKDSGVYGCSITNEYGTDLTDTLLSADSMLYFKINLTELKYKIISLFFLLCIT